MKKTIAILLAVLSLLSLAACAGNAESKRDGFAHQETNAAAADRNFYSYEKGAAVGYGGASDENLYYDYEPAEEYAPAEPGRVPENPQKLIRKIRLTVETDDYQAFMDGITGKVLALGGYIEDMDANTSGSYPRATIVIRVPADQLSELADSVAGIGNVTYKHESQQDVTLQYTDTESHIAALRTEHDRLLELLDKAENLSEVLQLEDRMTQVRYQLENYERSLRALSNQVEYATATIEVSQVKTFTPVEEEEEVGYWEKIGKGLSDGVKGMWEFLKELFSDFVIALPYLLLFLVLPAIILFVLIRRRIRRRKAARAAAAQIPAEPAKEAESVEENR